jgi:hypothetical protein
MSDQRFQFRLPLEDWPTATFETDYRLRGGTLFVEGEPLIRFADKAASTVGGVGSFRGHRIELRLRGDEPIVTLDGARAIREDRLRLPPSRSAWIHATIALLASAFGFAASYLYLLRAQSAADAWALKMAIHTAGWHLLLTLTLFPASVFGQRGGIRVVQLTSLVFFFIHLGMSLSNVEVAHPALQSSGIAIFNAASGLFFLASVIYGQRAHRDMSPEAVFGHRTVTTPPLLDASR